jgi:hypothetical protein
MNPFPETNMRRVSMALVRSAVARLTSDFSLTAAVTAKPREHSPIVPF